MNKSYLTLLFLLFSAVIFSQKTIVNFEDLKFAYDYSYGDISITPEGGPDANPDVTGINATANVRTLNMASSSGAYAGYGARIQGDQVNLATNGNFVSFYMRSTENNFRTIITFGDSPNNQNPSEGSFMYTGNGDWQLVEADVQFLDADGSQNPPVDLGQGDQAYEDVTLFPDVDDAIKTAFTIWVDEFKQNTAPVLSTEKFTEEVFSIYPNPATLAINIKGNIDVKKATIYDVTGKMVSSKAITGQFNSVDVSELAKGVYFLVLDNSNTFKFLKD